MLKRVAGYVINRLIVLGIVMLIMNGVVRMRNESGHSMGVVQILLGLREITHALNSAR